MYKVTSSPLQENMMFGAIFLTSLLLLFASIYWYFKRFSDAAHERLTRISGDRPEWFFGNLRTTGIFTGKRAFHEAFADLRQKYGDVFSFWLGPYYSIGLSRWEHIRQVLADRHTFDISEFTNRSFGVLFPTGLIALRGADWKRHARYMLPMFRRARILPYLETIVFCVDRFIDDQLLPNTDKIRTDLVPQCQNLLLNIIAFVAFDYDLHEATGKDSYLREAFNDFVHYGNQFVLSGGIPLWLGKLILRLHWKFQRARKILKEYVLKIISAEKARRDQQEPEVVNKSNRPTNLIASLVGATENESKETSLTPNEIFDEVAMSMLGGFETTSTALSWFIFYMTKYPEVQQRMKDELKEHGVTPDAHLTHELLDSLVYIDSVVKEVLRFAPITVGFSRQATCDTTIDDIPIRKGDMIMLATQNVHRDPRYWRVDPTKFIPERFLNEDKNYPVNVFLTFGGGHRACAGQDLALFELKVAMTRLMQRVTFEDPGDEADNSGGLLQRLTCFPKHLAARVHVIG